MNSEVLRGLEISAVSLVVLFGAMAILVLVISLLERSTRDNGGSAKAEPGAGETGAGTRAIVTGEPVDDDERMVAAIAVSLSRMRSLGMSQSGLGKGLESAPGTWWMMGKMAIAPASVVVKREED